jgi:hypothetical protein
MMGALALTATLAVALAAWAYWHKPRWSSVVLYGPLMALVIVSSVEMLGTIKPRFAEWRDMSDVEIVFYRLNEGVAIYVWVVLPGTTTPRAYSLPWDLQTAMKLRTAAQEAGQQGGRLMGRFNYEQSLDGRDAMFYAEPQSPGPQKDYGTQ